MEFFPGGGECALFVSLTNQMESLNEQAHTFAFDILFSQLKQKLSKVPHLKVSGQQRLVVCGNVNDVTRRRLSCSGLGNRCD